MQARHACRPSRARNANGPGYSLGCGMKRRARTSGSWWERDRLLAVWRILRSAGWRSSRKWHQRTVGAIVPSEACRLALGSGVRWITWFLSKNWARALLLSSCRIDQISSKLDLRWFEAVRFRRRATLVVVVTWIATRRWSRIIWSSIRRSRLRCAWSVLRVSASRVWLMPTYGTSRRNWNSFLQRRRTYQTIWVTCYRISAKMCHPNQLNPWPPRAATSRSSSGTNSGKSADLSLINSLKKW